MVLTKSSTRTFHRTLYAGELQSIILYKRGDDQQEGAVVPHILYQCRRSYIQKTGEPIAGDMASSHQVTWHIPRCELDRVKVQYINAADKIYDPVENVTYQPESTTLITIKLFGNFVNCICLRIDPAQT